MVEGNKLITVNIIYLEDDVTIKEERLQNSIFWHLKLALWRLTSLGLLLNLALTTLSISVINISSSIITDYYHQQMNKTTVYQMTYINRRRSRGIIKAPARTLEGRHKP